MRHPKKQLSNQVRDLGRREIQDDVNGGKLVNAYSLRGDVREKQRREERNGNELNLKYIC